jgi:RNA polymerase sigma-70 factor (ECF subfamily)
MPDWQEIIDLHGKAVWQTAYRLLGHRADADECFQEAFLDAFGISRRTEVSQWRALLKRLVTARAIDRLRQRARREVLLRLIGWNSLGIESPPAGQALEDGELSAALRHALSRLPRRQAEIFWLHSVEEMSYEEIATQLSMTVSAVGVALHRARARLSELLTPSGQAVPERTRAIGTIGKSSSDSERSRHDR